jgi:hypothetical protein
VAGLKTKRTRASVDAFLAGIKDEGRRRDCAALVKLMRQATGSAPAMWGASIVGFGTHHYKYASGREGDWFIVGFSPRKTDLTLYVMSGAERHAAQLAKLGPHKTGRSCLYIKRLADVDLDVLRRIVETTVKYVEDPDA